MSEYRLCAGSGPGAICKADTAERAIWYSSRCGYWTDDWSKLSSTSAPPGSLTGIPCCPKCGSVGFITAADVWYRGVSRFVEEGNPHYDEFCEQYKENCGVKVANDGSRTVDTWVDRYKAFLKTKGL